MFCLAGRMDLIEPFWFFCRVASAIFPFVRHICMINCCLKYIPSHPFLVSFLFLTCRSIATTKFVALCMHRERQTTRQKQLQIASFFVDLLPLAARLYDNDFHCCRTWVFSPQNIKEMICCIWAMCTTVMVKKLLQKMTIHHELPILYLLEKWKQGRKAQSTLIYASSNI